MATDPRIDDYIARQADFARPILAWLRERVHAACPQVEESIKWSMPAFGYKGRPLAHMAAFKAHAAFGFWDRVAMATGLEHEGMGQYGRIQSLADLPDAAALEALVRRALAPIDAGTVPKRAARAAKPEAEVPEALASAMAEDEAALTTWNGFPPGCRREYCEWIGEAKRTETRDKRVAQTVAQLREGKKLNWKYETC